MEAPASSALKLAIRESGLMYKEVADLMSCTTGRVSADAHRTALSMEKAIQYGRALGIDPAILRPDVLKPGEVTFK
jgi:hypothetical protein